MSAKIQAAMGKGKGKGRGKGLLALPSSPAKRPADGVDGTPSKAARTDVVEDAD